MGVCCAIAGAGLIAMKTKKTMMQSTTIKIRYPIDFIFARLSKWGVHLLVASPPVQDLLLSAKHLFVAARTVCHGLQ